MNEKVVSISPRAVLDCENVYRYMYVPGSKKNKYATLDVLDTNNKKDDGSFGTLKCIQKYKLENQQIIKGVLKDDIHKIDL